MRKSTWSLGVIILISVLSVVAPGRGITQEAAKQKAEDFIKKNQQGIEKIDYSSPFIQKMKVTEDRFPVLPNPEGKEISRESNIKGKLVWQITYETVYDKNLAAYILYIDYHTGKVYGWLFADG